MRIVRSHANVLSAENQAIHTEHALGGFTNGSVVALFPVLANRYSTWACRDSSFVSTWASRR